MCAAMAAPLARCDAAGGAFHIAWPARAGMASWYRQDDNADANGPELAGLLAAESAPAAPFAAQQPLAEAQPVVCGGSNTRPSGSREDAAS